VKDRAARHLNQLAQIACLVGAVLVTTGHPVHARPVSWETLRPTSIAPFDDPFRALTRAQLLDLRSLAKLLQQGVAPEDGTEEGKRLAGLYKGLADQGVDADALLSRRAEITANGEKLRHGSTLKLSARSWNWSDTQFRLR